jgi:hypothetical protein
LRRGVSASEFVAEVRGQTDKSLAQKQKASLQCTDQEWDDDDDDDDDDDEGLPVVDEAAPSLCTLEFGTM